MILKDYSLASDGFFPFSDNIEVANEYGVKCIVQPGGSIRDDEIINMCDQFNIKISCIQTRSFCH
jgi:phosphoribosylaminoimidazolecarboxamide formyltransferase/IMP cyclohydrolase